MRLRHLVPLLALVAGCRDATPTSPRLQVTIAGIFEEGVRLSTGESLTVRGTEAEALFLDGGPEGAEFLYLPFAATATGALNVQVVGTNIRTPVGLPTLARAPLAAPEPSFAVGPHPDEGFHQRLRERERRELAPLWRPGSGPSRSLSPLPQRVPTVGETMTINVNAANPCADPRLRTARVAAVTERAIVLHDEANPAGGFTDADYRHIGMTFDTLLYPLSVRTFGEPTDIDGNQRVLIFYSVAVNQLTPPGSTGFVAGFFFARDLFPRTETPRLQACPASNEAEIFYMLVPDERFPVGFVRNNTLGTVVHEFQHLINASRRIYVNDATSFEAVWLDEGLSHVAEEIAFYQASGLGPEQNIDLETLVATSRRVLDAVNTYQVQNLVRYITFLEAAEETSPMGPDNLATRGAAWAYLRYAADHQPTPQEAFFFSLVNSRTAGLQNLSNALEDPLEVMRTWSASVMTDDAVPVASSLLQQPSWDFRSVLPALLPEGQAYPLQVATLQPDVEREVTLQPGSAAYLRFRVEANQRAVVQTTSGAAPVPASFQGMLVRLR